jgi:hypothetical protein
MEKSLGQRGAEVREAKLAEHSCQQGQMALQAPAE